MLEFGHAQHIKESSCWDFCHFSNIMHCKTKPVSALFTIFCKTSLSSCHSKCWHIVITALHRSVWILQCAPVFWGGMTEIVVCRQMGTEPTRATAAVFGWFSTAHWYVCTDESGRFVSLWGFSEILAKNFFKSFPSVPMRTRWSTRSILIFKIE